VIYSFIDKNVKGINTRELMRHAHDTEVKLEPGLRIPDDASLVSVHGVKRGNDDVIIQANNRKIPWMYMDNADHYFSSMYKRVVVDGTAPVTFREERRFDHNTELKKWRGGEGDYIIVLPPSIPYMDTFNERNFLNGIVQTINVHTDKDIIVRSKPAKGRLAKPWDEQLANAYAVITWGSALALDAMIKGVPTISLGFCPAKLSSFQLTDLETDALKEEPPRMETIDNLTWCCFKRKELPIAYFVAMENYHCKSDYNEKLKKISSFNFI